MSKLTEEQERRLIDDFRGGTRILALAEWYGVNSLDVEHVIRKELKRTEKEQKR